MLLVTLLNLFLLHCLWFFANFTAKLQDRQKAIGIQTYCIGNRQLNVKISLSLSSFIIVISWPDKSESFKTNIAGTSGSAPDSFDSNSRPPVDQNRKGAKLQLIFYQSPGIFIEVNFGWDDSGMEKDQFLNQTEPATQPFDLILCPV